MTDVEAPRPPTRECSKCQAPILWRRHVYTGQLAPIDAEPSPEGRLILLPGGETYRIAQAQSAPGPRHTNHFATCPYAHHFRRATPAQARRMLGSR